MFEPIKKEEERNNLYKSQQIYIDLQNEYDEDKELLDLLEGKSIFFFDFLGNKENKEKENNKTKVLCENIIPEEDEDKQKTELKFYKIKDKEQKLNEDNKGTKSNNQKVKKPKYLKKMIIDINNNNVNEKITSSSNIIQNLYSNNLNPNPLFTSWNMNKINQEKEKKHISKIFSSNQNQKNNIYLPEINTINLLKQNLNINNNLDTQSTTNESKKNSNSNNTDEYSKDRIDLMSAKFKTNLNINSASSNIIIPMIPLRRPNSNFNFGGNLLWEKMDNLNNKILNTEIIEKNNYNSRNIHNSNSLERGKISTTPLINNTVKLHKIKIEKGMMNIKFADNINKKFYNFELNEYYLNNNNLYNKNSFKKLLCNRKQPLKISKVKSN